MSQDLAELGLLRDVPIARFQMALMPHQQAVFSHLRQARPLRLGTGRTSEVRSGTPTPPETGRETLVRRPGPRLARAAHERPS